MAGLPSRLNEPDFEKILGGGSGGESDDSDEIELDPPQVRLRRLKLFLKKVREAKADLEVERMHIMALRELHAAKSTGSNVKYKPPTANQNSSVRDNDSSVDGDVNDSSLNLNIPVLSQMVRGEYFLSEEEEEDDDDDDDERDVESDGSTSVSDVAPFNEETDAIPFSSEESDIDLQSH